MAKIGHYIDNYLQRTASAAPLATYRILFGLLIFVGTIRFWLMGWIDALYIKPSYFFSYYGFEFVKPLHELTYALFAICAIASLFLALGFYYRISSIVLFLSFTYIELMDKSTYLNHYYFVSLICFLFILVPANVAYSIDSFRKGHSYDIAVPQWTIDSIKLFIVLVYFFAGLAKLNSDWLFHALPLKIWLPAKNDIPVIGKLFNFPQTAFIFSWVGCIYDLTVPFFLLIKSTRIYAFIAVLIFHVLTAVLFPIGMFPYIMIASTIIFFSEKSHRKILNIISKLLRIKIIKSTADTNSFHYRAWRKPVIVVLILFFVAQITIPFRHLLYPGELFWTEEGYRFSWRVMLMEKAGTAEFTVQDETRKLVVNNREFLTPLQEKMMATQPDMLIQYAHMLYEYYSKNGFNHPRIFVDSYVSLNGRLGKPLVAPTIDLAKEKDSFKHKNWIEPFNDEISGL